MTPNEAGALLAYANQIDPLISLSDANVDVWWESLQRHEYEQALWCIKDYYANTKPGWDGRVPAIGAALLRQRIGDKRHLVESQQRALEPPPKHTNPESFRARDPEAWARLVAKGRDDHRADLVRRGIPLLAGQVSDAA